MDKQKRALGGAVKRTRPSAASQVYTRLGLPRGRVLDYGCGFGFDADHFGWESYDPYYRPRLPEGIFDIIVCTNVLNALSRNNRAKVLAAVGELLVPDGRAFFAVPRDVPLTGKLGMHHSMQNYVVLSLPVVYEDETLAVYEFTVGAVFEDSTKDYISPRDRRRMR